MDVDAEVRRAKSGSVLSNVDERRRSMKGKR